MRPVLAVFAHPDDESWGCAGTFALYSKLGVECHLLTATAGEAGFPDNLMQELPETERKAIRAQELEEAAKIVGLASYRILGIPDGGVEAEREHLESAVSAEIERLRPAAVITFDETGITGHSDHIAVHEAVTAAFSNSRARGCRLFYQLLPERSVRAMLDANEKLQSSPPFLPKPWEGRPPQKDGSAGPHFVPDARIDVEIDTAEFASIKRDAIAAHRSQTSGLRFLEDASEQVLRLVFAKEYYQLAAGPALPSVPAHDLLEGLG